MSYSIPDKTSRDIREVLEAFKSRKLRDEFMGNEPLAPLVFAILVEQLRATAIISEQLESIEEYIHSLAGYGKR